MKKPTSILNFKIIEFLFNNEEVAPLLKRRDNHEKAIGVELKCRYIKKDPENKEKSRYVVDFIYKTKDDFKEDKDDISVMVEVTEGERTLFEIKGIRQY